MIPIPAVPYELLYYLGYFGYFLCGLYIGVYYVSAK